MQVAALGGPNVGPAPVTIRLNSVPEEEENSVESIVKKSLNEAWDENAEKIRKTAKEQAALKIDTSTEHSTTPLKAAITRGSSAPLANIVNPVIDTYVKNTAKKVADHSIDTFFNSKSSINTGVDLVSRWKQSFSQYIYSFFSTPCDCKKVEENIESK